MQCLQKSRSFNKKVNPLHVTNSIAGVSSTKLLETIHAADAVLAEIVQLSSLIRKASKKSHVSSADRSLDGDDPVLQRLARHLTYTILARPNNLEHMRRSAWTDSELEYPVPLNSEQPLLDPLEASSWGVSVSSSQLSVVQSRLLHANLVRRNRFKYSQNRNIRDKAARGPQVTRRETSYNPSQEQESSKIHSTTEDQNSSIDPTEGTDVKPEAPRDAPNRAKIELPATTVPSEKTFSSLDSQVLKQTAESTTMSGHSATTVAARIETQYPRPPIAKDIYKIVKCPCCCVALGREKVKGSRWRYVL